MLFNVREKKQKPLSMFVLLPNFKGNYQEIIPTRVRRIVLFFGLIL